MQGDAGLDCLKGGGLCLKNHSQAYNYNLDRPQGGEQSASEEHQQHGRGTGKDQTTVIVATSSRFDI